LSTTVPRLVMFVAATFVHELMFGGLQAITGSGRFSVKMSAVLLQALVNGFVGAGAFLLVENGPQVPANRPVRAGGVSGRGRGCVGGGRGCVVAAGCRRLWGGGCGGRGGRGVGGARGPGGGAGGWGGGFGGCLGFGVLRVPRVRGSPGSPGSGFCEFSGFGV